MLTLSVNDTIDRLPEFIGTEICVTGQLSLDFEGQCISHLPRSGRVGRDYRSSIWVRFDLQLIGHPEQWLYQFNGRSVVVAGRLFGPAEGLDGCGHFSLWPAEIVVAIIEKP